MESANKDANMGEFIVLTLSTNALTFIIYIIIAFFRTRERNMRKSP
jgi:phage shock protein PspC (stress-responsive transcriptional regulator)